MTPADLDTWFEHIHQMLEAAYIAHTEPWRQSGMSGPKERWDRLRRPVADCIDRPGSLLDIGCANGYMLECCLGWTAERGIAIEPFGLDLSTRLVELARERLPHHVDNLFVGNAWSWVPPRRITYVRTELVYVPGEFERRYIDRLRAEFLEPGGRLLIANYAEGKAEVARSLTPENHATVYLLERLEALGVPVVTFSEGIDPHGRGNTLVAVVE